MDAHDDGFWGRACARLTTRNKELEDEIAALKRKLEWLKGAFRRARENESHAEGENARLRQRIADLEANTPEARARKALGDPRQGVNLATAQVLGS
jgi:predicted RNase H-like nuclease (RuvC/YqgF family)